MAHAQHLLHEPEVGKRLAMTVPMAVIGPWVELAQNALEVLGLETESVHPA